MKVRRTPPLIAQTVAALAVLIGIGMAINVVSFFGGPHSGDYLGDPPPWWGRPLRLCAISLMFTIPALAYKLTHQFFCWSYRGYGYPIRPAPIRFRHLFLFAFSTITVGSNVLYWSFVGEGIWIPPYLESILRFGMRESAVVVLISAAVLFFTARRHLWTGLTLALASIGLYFLSPLSRQ